MNADQDAQHCAHEGCTCTLHAGEGIMMGGEFYCSAECARGEGCDHENCDCAEKPL
jgi:hypothetical protein